MNINVSTGILPPLPWNTWAPIYTCICRERRERERKREREKEREREREREYNLIYVSLIYSNII